MDLSSIAKVVTLHSRRGKCLVAKDNKKSVGRGLNGRNARWSVELVPDSPSFIRLKSCDGNYLTASNQIRKFGGFKVHQRPPQGLDNSIEWKPIREEGTHSNQVIKLMTREGTYLRACGIRWNRVTHERNANIKDGILWDVEILEITLKAASTCYNRATPTEKELAHDYFTSMDTDGDGKVSIDEFVNFFKEIDSRMDRSIFDALDENRDGSLEFLEVFRLHHMLNRPQAQPFMKSLEKCVDQPGAQNERGKFQRRAKTLLAFLTMGIQIVALATGGCAF